ncbi:hypothetical protein CFBP5507_23425 [Agrobacterium salinitolerans]|uniref:Uncharacterized protein n=2 Tax=Agrobacterium salinitolerans TaxID=1183413 RepID=A0A4Z1QMT1_9HYPH|nr:hypothetical protein [Agrobacterium salinitolerans]MCZ7865217.1 hypothetical protein [Agrobacterium salinitolerans]UYZ10569.1 hypothetical protein CFBP5507_23425 [Agrobacterium salinitolerans]
MLPRLKSITAKPHGVLTVEWADGGQSSADLTGWIATCGELLAPLLSEDIWKTATIADFGASVEWDGQHLEIDADHLCQITENQHARRR